MTLADILWDLLICFGLSSVVAVVLFLAIKQRVRAWVFLLIGIAPIVILYISNPIWRVYSDHGFMHLSFVYQIMNGYVPPDNIMLGGEKALYAWGHHSIAAIFAHIFNVSPATIFAIGNIIALLFTLIVVYKIAELFTHNRVAGIFSATLAVFGVSYFTRGPFVDLAHFALGSVGFDYKVSEYRALAVAKLYNFNSNGIGILFFALFLYLTLRVISGNGTPRNNYVGLGLASFGLIFFYPYYLLDMLAVTFSTCLTVYLWNRGKLTKNLYRLVGSIILGAIAASPYIYLVASGKTESLHSLTPNLGWILGKGLILFFAVFPIAILLLFQRKAFFNKIEDNMLPFVCLLSAIVTLGAMYVFLKEPLGVNYKHLILCLFCVGIIGGIVLQGVYERYRLVSFVLVVAFIIPFSYDWLSIVNVQNWPFSDPFVEDGKYLRHADSDEDALYQWIANNTAKDSVFVDTHLTVPVFGRRQLYVGSTIREDRLPAESRSIENGWELTPEKFLLSQGYSSDVIDNRLAVVNDIYDPSIELDKNIVSELQKAKTQHIFVVARDSLTNQKLSDSPYFTQVFEHEDRSVFELISNQA